LAEGTIVGTRQPKRFLMFPSACPLFIFTRSLPSCFAERLLNSLGLTASSHSRLQFK